MGAVTSFSSARFSTHTSSGFYRACLVDTNFLIALAYEPHKFHEDVQEFYEILTEEKIPLYVTLSTRSEFLDFERRTIATEQILGMLSKESPWKITAVTRQKLYPQKTWVDQQSSRNDLPVLTDKRIKDCKKLFTPLRASGHAGWLDFCDFYLKGLLERWEKASEVWGLNYLGTRETENSALFQKKLAWKEMYSLSAKTCLGSFDAMILNAFLSSKIEWLVSLDYDLAYGIRAESDPRTVLVPDALFKNHFKKLRF